MAWGEKTILITRTVDSAVLFLLVSHLTICSARVRIIPSTNAENKTESLISSDAQPDGSPTRIADHEDTCYVRRGNSFGYVVSRRRVLLNPEWLEGCLVCILFLCSRFFFCNVDH